MSRFRAPKPFTKTPKPFALNHGGEGGGVLNPRRTREHKPHNVETHNTTPHTLNLNPLNPNPQNPKPYLLNPEPKTQNLTLNPLQKNEQRRRARGTTKTTPETPEPEPPNPESYLVNHGT